MDKIDKYLLLQALDNMINIEDAFEEPKYILDSVMYDLKKMREMVINRD